MGTKKDAETDDDEYFWFDIYKTIYDAENYNYYQWDKGYIDDDASAANALNNYTYAITTTIVRVTKLQKVEKLLSPLQGPKPGSDVGDGLYKNFGGYSRLRRL